MSSARPARRAGVRKSPFSEFTKMSTDWFRFDSRDTQFILREQLHVERLFEFADFRDFSLSDVDLLLSESVKFATEVMAPANIEGDRQGCTYNDGEVKAPAAFRAAYRQQCEAGWLGITTPTEYGGQGLPYTIGAAIGESFVGANCSLSMVGGLTRAAADLIIAFADPEMKKRYLPPLVDGRWQGTMCLTEAHAGTAVGDLHTTAAKRDGEYYLRGNKIFISGGDHDLVENVIHLVLARCENAPAGTKGLSLFLVPKFRVADDGSLAESNDVTCTGIEEKLGIHGSPTCAMAFGENDACIGHLIGEEQQGLELMFRMMNWARVGVGVQGLGLAAAAYQSALAYAAERVQGVDMKEFRNPDAPRVTINRHPDVKRMLATMKAYVEGSRALLLHAAWCLDVADHSGDDTLAEKYGNRVELLTPICKAWSSDVACEVTNLALQTYGGHGYLKDYPVEQLVRDARIAPIYEGTNGIQALDLLGRKVGKAGGAVFMELMSDIGGFLQKHREHPTLAATVQAAIKRKEQLEQTTMNFGMAQMSGDLDFPLLHATPYLRMFGNTVAAWLLLEQAVIAHDALAPLVESAGDDPDKTAALFADHADARYYDNKIKTAQFFVSSLLTQNDALAAAIESGDRSALEMHFEPTN